MWKVYIFLCDQKTYYIGLTSNLNKRIRSHKLGQNLSTKRFSDIRLVYWETYSSRKLAEYRERQLKGWSAAKKKALVEGNKNLLKRLSKNLEFCQGRHDGEKW